MSKLPKVDHNDSTKYKDIQIGHGTRREIAGLLLPIKILSEISRFFNRLDSIISLQTWLAAALAEKAQHGL